MGKPDEWFLEKCLNSRQHSSLRDVGFPGLWSCPAHWWKKCNIWQLFAKYINEYVNLKTRSHLLVLPADGDGTVPLLLPLPQVPDTVSPGPAPVLWDLLLPAVLAKAAEQPPTTHSGRLCTQQLGCFLWLVLLSASCKILLVPYLLIPSKTQHKVASCEWQPGCIWVNSAVPKLGTLGWWLHHRLQGLSEPHPHFFPQLNLQLNSVLSLYVYMSQRCQVGAWSFWNWRDEGPSPWHHYANWISHLPGQYKPPQHASQWPDICQESVLVDAAYCSNHPHIPLETSRIWVRGYKDCV